MQNHNMNNMNEQILETIEIAHEAAEQLYSLMEEGQFAQFLRVFNDLGRMLTGIKSIIAGKSEFKRSAVYLNNAMASLRNFQRYVKEDSYRKYIKIEFELLPLLEELYYEYYIAAKVMGNVEREYRFFFEECPEFGGNRYINRSLETGEYPYDISISVIAYNHLDYTKQCVESILKYTPDHLKCELILVNHGSNDGTKEYFESIAPTKQIDLAENLPGTNIASKVVQGKYWCYISNDVIVTENYMDNLLKCMQSDDQIAHVVPTTPNISNLQAIPADYKTMEEMFVWAKNNNISDPYRWEQRTRLCNPMGLTKSELVSSKGEFWKLKLLNEHMAYPDDGLAALYRRKKQKMILAKDVYCYHFGSVTIGNGKETTADYSEGRRIFQKFFSIDPWGTGFCYDSGLFSALRVQDTDPVTVLGMNCGIGSNPLKIREELKENAHNQNIQIYNVTAERCYLEDLKGLSDAVMVCKNFSNCDLIFPKIKFSYIIVEEQTGIPDARSFQKKLMRRLKKGGKLLFLGYTKGANMVIDSTLYQGKKWGCFIQNGGQ